MPDEQKKPDSPVVTRPGGRWTPGIAPTGTYLTSEGSSVETDADVATAEDIPETEEIFERDERRKKGEELPYLYPAGPHAPAGGAAGGAKTVDETEQPSEEKRKPHEMYEEGAWEKGE